MGERKTYLSYLNVIACISVVILHVNSDFWNYSHSLHWAVANVIESIFYFAVPIFFMMSGATLINYYKKYTTKEYFKKRICKTVIPYIFWTIISIVWFASFKSLPLKDINMRLIVECFLNTKFINIYWFFIPLFMVYLSIPVLSCVEESKREKIFLYSIICLLVINSGYPLLCNYLRLQYNGSFSFLAFSSWIIYVLIGYFVDNYEIRKKVRICIYILGIMSLLTMIFGTMFLSFEHETIIETFKGNLNVPCVVYSSAIFIWFKYHNFNKINTKVTSVINRLCKYTFGVYLIHWYIIDVVNNELHFYFSSMTYKIFGIFVVLVICLVVLYVLKKIPIINKIVP